MFRMVLMSGVWYSTKIRDFDGYVELADSMALIESGDIVAFTDDVEYFADALDIDLGDIVDVNE